MSSFRAFSALLVFLTVSATTAVTDVPYPTCEDAGCTNPADFGSYLHLEEGQLPIDFHPSSSSAWKYLPRSGLNIVGAWWVTTGRPDVVIAVLDSGIRWGHQDLARKLALNIGELPLPSAALWSLWRLFLFTHQAVRC